MANPTFLKMFGLDSEEEFKRISVADVYMNPKDRKPFSGNLLSKGSVNGVELPLKKKDGTPFWGSVSARVVHDESGKTPRFDCTIIDITAQKKAEEEREKLQAQLQRAQKMEALGTLAGGVAHDLNNILAGLVSYPELLLMEIPEDSPLRKPILTIKNSGERAATIVQDLLTLARRGVSTMQVVNLNDIISEYLKSPEHEKLRLFHPDLQLETNFEEDLLNILGSPVHLSKTVMNLISNAAEAMPGGGKISISTKNRYIDRRIRGYDNVDEGAYITLTVSDTGVGISPEDMERMFEPFYTKKVMGRSGTGLGMAVVWGTIKDHRGYIDVKSAKGKGTTFTLYFPVSREELAKEKPGLSIEDYMGKGESVLVVDDVEEQRDIASRILRRLGYSARTVSSGEEAVDYMKGNSVDLLLLDMIMEPGIDGYETYKRILELHPEQKAIIVSGFSETERVKDTQRLGAGAYVKKPYLLEKIGIAIRGELDK
jgi:two-component system cell cycle sensor histidine kinase/response regulator CckA